MRRAFVLFPILFVALLAGCAEQPTDHVGTWKGEAFSILKGLNPTYTFAEDGKVQMTLQGDATVQEGTYKIDYSKKPTWIDIKWADGGVQTGILRFVGTGKSSMEVRLVFGDRRPGDFGGDGTIFLKRR